MEQVDEASGNAMAEVTTAVVEAILEPLRPAMVAMRAKVEVGFPYVFFSLSICWFAVSWLPTCSNTPTHGGAGRAELK